MSDVMQPGDRVRLTASNRQPASLPGDKGRVLAGPNPSPNGETYYVVLMGDGFNGRRFVFMSDEIERDE